jgi:dihydrofolate reductase
MRKVMFAMNISIDGCCDHTKFAPDKELMPYFTQLMHDTGLIVYGRKTYELMVPYWPDVAKNKSASPDDVDFAEAMTPIPKIVLSRTLETADANTTIVRGDPEGLLRELKQQAGKKIALSSTEMLPQMLTLGLIDELYLIVHPVLVGDNKRLFEDFLVPERRHFKLREAKLFNSGAIALHYEKND